MTLNSGIKPLSSFFQAKSEDKGPKSSTISRVAHVPVNITVLDKNDNCPMFVNLPYYAVVPVDALKGGVITKVRMAATL